MAKGCDIENNTDTKENQVQVLKERCSISQEWSFNSNSSSKSNIEYITELKKVRINNMKNIFLLFKVR